MKVGASGPLSAENISSPWSIGRTSVGASRIGSPGIVVTRLDSASRASNGAKAAKPAEIAA